VQPGALHRYAPAGVDVVTFSGTVYKPVTAAYDRWLAANGFPTSVSSDQVQAQLRAQGIDVAAAFTAVGGRMNPAQTHLLTSILAKPIPLQYEYVYAGNVSIEPKSGTIENVQAQKEGLAVKPDLSGVAQLRPLLAQFASVPAVKAVSDGLDRLVAQPPQLAAVFQYAQTPASSASVGDDTREQLRLMNLMELRIPWTAAVAGGLLLVLDAALMWRRHRRVGLTVTIPGDDLVPARAPAAGR